MKHLEFTKNCRFPIEVLVRGKDTAEKEEQLVKMAEVIKTAGVSLEWDMSPFVASATHACTSR